MNTYFWQLAMGAATLVLGVVIGFLLSEASRRSSARAEAAESAAAPSDESATSAAAPKSSATPARAEAGKKPQRIGAVIGVNRQTLDRYVELHKAVWPSVLRQIRQSNIRNYSIYLGELDDGNLYLFAYYEYVGDDLAADMKKMAADPETQRWWQQTDPLQVPQKNRKKGEHWMQVQEVFHTD